MSRIVEFGTSPSLGKRPDGAWGHIWHSKVAVDLRWVVGAKPFDTDPTASWIVLAGSNEWFAIDCSYGDFMEKWMDSPVPVAPTVVAAKYQRPISGPGTISYPDVPE